MHPFSQLILLCFLGGVLIPGSSAKDYWEAGLKKHNEYRRAHNTPRLELDSGLARIADKCAQYYAAKGTIDHSCPDRKNAKAGENLTWGSPGADLNGVQAVAYATQRWYDEIENWDFNRHGRKHHSLVVGHFTQVIWKESKKLGMGYVKNHNGIFVVGLYLPAGNRGRYKENVLPLSPGGAGVGGAEVGGAEAGEAEGADVTVGGAGSRDSDSYNSSASIPSTLIRGQKGQGATCLALVMTAGLVTGGGFCLSNI